MPQSVNLKDTGGRLIEPTEEDIARIEEWAGRGSGHIHIARALKVSVDTMRAWRKRHPAVDSAFAAGREAEHTALRDKAMELAMNGNPILVMFLLKTRHGYREGEQLEQSNRVNITFNLPSARTVEPITIDASGTDTQPERVSTTSP